MSTTNDERWVPIPNYENYEISDHGQVKSFARGKEKILKPRLKRGYQTVALYNDTGLRTCYVHRLVGEAFVPNPEGLPYVNHLDGDKENSHYANLEFCTAKQNRQHGIEIGLIDLRKRAVVQLTLDGVEVARYDSMTEAGIATGIASGNIYSVASGAYRQTRGFRWAFV